MFLIAFNGSFVSDSLHLFDSKVGPNLIELEHQLLSMVVYVISDIMNGLSRRSLTQCFLRLSSGLGLEVGILDVSRLLEFLFLINYGLLPGSLSLGRLVFFDWSRLLRCLLLGLLGILKYECQLLNGLFFKTSSSSVSLAKGIPSDTPFTFQIAPSILPLWIISFHVTLNVLYIIVSEFIIIFFSIFI